MVVVVLKTETKLKNFDEDAFPERDALFPNWLLCTCTSIQTPQSLDSFSKLQDSMVGRSSASLADVATERPLVSSRTRSDRISQLSNQL